MGAFRTRLISGAILLALAITFGYFGGYALAGILLILSLVGSFEILRVFKLQKTPMAICLYLLTVGYYLLLVFAPLGMVLPFFALMLIIIMGFYVFTYPKFKADDVAKVFFAFFYVSLMLSFIYLTRNLPGGIYIIWLIFLSSWGCDTCAYCVGVLFGKHKMSPKLSPKKSVEGAVGGVVGTVILTFIFLFLLRVKMDINMSEVIIISLLSSVGALSSMVGDLAASAIKRNYGIKDYGKLIPGHGGVMDRFDSVIVTAPIIYVLGLFFL